MPSKSEWKVRARRIARKEAQLQGAIKYYLEMKCRGHAAVKTGLFPLLKHGSTIDRRMDGKCAALREDKKILTFKEEQLLVR